MTEPERADGRARGIVLGVCSQGGTCWAVAGNSLEVVGLGLHHTALVGQLAWVL